MGIVSIVGVAVGIVRCVGAWGMGWRQGSVWGVMGGVGSVILRIVGCVLVVSVMGIMMLGFRIVRFVARIVLFVMRSIPVIYAMSACYSTLILLFASLALLAVLSAFTTPCCLLPRALSVCLLLM